MEAIIRWLIKTFLKNKHLHSDPKPKLTAVINFPKEGADGDESIFAPGSATWSLPKEVNDAGNPNS